MRPLNPSTTLKITNPLVLYRSLVSTKQIEPDPAQHRLAIHLQKVHERLRDYRPDLDFRERLQHLRFLVAKGPSQSERAASRSQEAASVWSSWRRRRSKDVEVTALAKSLTDQQSAIELNSPQGLLLHGEVGTGKSFLVELLGECLPGDRVRRWHFNTFMLGVYAQIEKLRRFHATTEFEEYALLNVSRDLIFKSPILFIDEFQFPDRASSKILSNLLTSFFHLGGVLVATSNRMPEQLADAAGLDFNASAPRREEKPDREALNRSRRQIPRQHTSGRSDFADFLDLLKARCEIWNIEGSHDWRRKRTGSQQPQSLPVDQRPTNVDGFAGLNSLEMGNLGRGFEQSSEVSSGAVATLKNEETTSSETPSFYFEMKSGSQLDSEQQQRWNESEVRAIQRGNLQHENGIPWEADSVNVYGRTVIVPQQFNGVTKWHFEKLCAAYLGPADYVTLASTFHTFIITDVPILSLLHKNEARRFITLLDALYEARCNLLISASSHVDCLLFPERLSGGAGNKPLEGSGFESVYSETFSEIHQDQTSPFRPNITAYTASASPPNYHTSPVQVDGAQYAATRSILADEDSDFGPMYGAGRHQGHSSQSDEARTVNRPSRPEFNFSRIETFTGQDEMFAYKRAESRLWEMCSERWWSRGIGSWRPLAKDARHWESPIAAQEASNDLPITQDMPSAARDDALFQHGASPFRRSEKPPPRFNWTHAWGMALWGKKAGAWGQGPQGLADRKDASK